MPDELPANVPVRITKAGKEPQEGFLSVGQSGNVAVYQKGRIGDRLILSRDPVKYSVMVDPAGPAVVVDGQRFELDPQHVDEVDVLITHAVYMRTNAPQPAASASPSSPLASWAGALVVFSAVIGVLGIIGGLILAFQTDETFTGTDRPFLAAGIAVSVNAAFVATAGIVLGLLAGAYAFDHQSSDSE